MTTMANRLSINPARVMSLIRTMPEPNIIVLVGVATGNINAQLAAMVIGIINTTGSNPILIAMEAKIGVSAVTLAIFELISVKKTISTMTARTMTASW